MRERSVNRTKANVSVHSSLLAVFVLLGATLLAASASAAPCTAEQRRQLDRELAGPNDATVNVTCDLELENTTVRKRLVFKGAAASGVTLECNNATIESSHSASNPTVRIVSDGFSVPNRVTIRGCTIKGNVRIWGWTNSGNDEAARPASGNPGFTELARNLAPRNILLDRLTLVADGDMALYVAMGVTGVTLSNSTLRGAAATHAIYLDHESGFHVLENNTFSLKTGPPATSKSSIELIAVDGSSDNLIIGNRFNHLAAGGIYLYRNCGERGTTRHNMPQRNHIINNHFYYVGYRGGNPAVYFGSRNGSRPKCHEDDHHDIGSGKDGRDHARYNVVMQNQFTARSPQDMIRTGNPDVDSPNYVAHNELVTNFAQRKSGCFLASRLDDDFLLDGESKKVAIRDGSVDRCVVQRCSDGVLETTGTCELSARDFGCQKTGDNAGCSTRVPSCPANTEALAAKAACNLEHGSVSASTVASLDPGKIDVTRTSTNVNDGTCQVGDTSVRQHSSIVRATRHPLTASCKEHDRNGGDCHVRGQLLCGGRNVVSTAKGPIRGVVGKIPIEVIRDDKFEDRNPRRTPKLPSAPKQGRPKAPPKEPVKKRPNKTGK